MAEKYKIVWLTHFYDSNLESLLKIDKNGRDFAVWVREFAAAFQNDSRYEIHIVSPNMYNGKTSNFVHGTVFYHLYKFDILHFFNNKLNIIIDKFVRRLGFNYLSNFYLEKKIVRKVVQSINPDLIHLFGAENPNYSSTIRQFVGKYPIFVSIQGFIKNTTADHNFKIRQRIKIEREIIQSCSNFGILSYASGEEICSINPYAQIYYHHYPKTRPHVQRDEKTKSDYDCVFFSRLTPSKGIEDLLKSIALLKSRGIEISLLILGSSTKGYLKILKNLCCNLGIERNVIFYGHCNSRELYEKVISAKVAILPSYAEVMPGMVNEAMYMKIPVIAYNVGGLPDLNKNSRCIHLVPVGSIKVLSDTIVHVISEKQKAEVVEMVDNAFKESLVYFDKNLIFNELDNIYKILIAKK